MKNSTWVFTEKGDMFVFLVSQKLISEEEEGSNRFVCKSFSQLFKCKTLLSKLDAQMSKPTD